MVITIDLFGDDEQKVVDNDRMIEDPPRIEDLPREDIQLVIIQEKPKKVSPNFWG